MKYFFFRQKRDKLQDKRLQSRPIREFKIEAETEERAINKLSSTQMANRKTPFSENMDPIELSVIDINELFDVHEFNYAIHGNVPDLKIG